MPGDKSISHRALILGSVAQGTTHIQGLLESDDCLNTAKCLGLMGSDLKRIGPGEYIIHSAGLSQIGEASDILDAGNSGTTLRLLLGLVSSRPHFYVLSGDASLRQRPMERVVKPLRQMGARILGRQGASLAPLAVTGGGLVAESLKSSVASAQVKSAILLAGLGTVGVTSITEPSLSRDHTERMLAYLGCPVMRRGNTISIEGPGELEGREIVVPGDFSSAAFLLTAAVLLPHSKVTIKDVNLNPTRTGFLEVLSRMGAAVEIDNVREVCGEPVGDLTASTSNLYGCMIDGELIPRVIDELPLVALLGSQAKGETKVVDAAELRVKESDRISTTATELGKLGVVVDTFADGFSVQGGQIIRGGSCSSCDDHRIAMMLVVAGLLGEEEVAICDPGCIRVSFPGYGNLLNELCFPEHANRCIDYIESF
ncbi:MAG: 3-phosphoshikimate 1-carboxyvinyltransferase [Limnochordia bacterium]|nr:3-phosphoshikimate 1-carboxyvinyltransferase [Limnochordia bacterium]